MSKIAEMQKFIRHWKDVTGETEIDMIEVAKLALKMGWDAPPAISREERLANSSRAQRARTSATTERQAVRTGAIMRCLRRTTTDGRLASRSSTLTIRTPSRTVSVRRALCAASKPSMI